jgi:hypothetical protein
MVAGAERPEHSRAIAARRPVLDAEPGGDAVAGAEEPELDVRDRREDRPQRRDRRPLE